MVELEKDQKRTYRAVYHTRDQRFVQLGQIDIPEIHAGDEGQCFLCAGSPCQTLSRKNLLGRIFLLTRTSTSSPWLAARQKKSPTAERADDPDLSPKGALRFSGTVRRIRPGGAHSVRNDRRFQLTDNPRGSLLR